MSDAKANEPVWDSFRRVVTLLLAACVILLAANAALVWLYLSATSENIAQALLAIKEQQAASNLRLDVVRGDLESSLNAIRDELYALNEKASKAADVAPPGTNSSQ